MNNKKPLPKVVTFAVLTALTAFVWIGFEIYRAFTKEPSPSVAPEITADLNPTLDTAALANLVQRINLEEAEIGETQAINPEDLQPESPQAEVPAELPPEEATEEVEQVEEENADGI